MPQLSAGSIVLLVVVAAFTATAAVWDFRHRRIPNQLTLPVFIAGWLFQVGFRGWTGVQDAALGFALGFGTLLVLWLIGGGGGGDVKLMAALSVWLGFHLTLFVLIVSTVLVILGTGSYLLWSLFTGNLKRTARKHLATGKAKKGKKPKAETVEEKQGRRVMAFAIPVALATWLVLVWKLPTLP